MKAAALLVAGAILGAAGLAAAVLAALRFYDHVDELEVASGHVGTRRSGSPS